MKPASQLLIAQIVLMFAGCAGGHTGTSPLPELTEDTSLRDAEAALTAHPRDPDAYRRLIQEYLHASRFNEAYEKTQELRALDPNTPDNLILLGRACYGLGLFDEAAACYHSVLQTRPDDVQSLLELESLLVARGSLKEARQLLESAIDRGVHEWALYERAMALARSPDEERTWLELFLQKSPNHAEASAMLETLEKRGRLTNEATIVEGGDRVAEVKMSDSYIARVAVNGKPALFLVDLSSRGIHLNDEFVKRRHLDGAIDMVLPGIGSRRQVRLEKLELGSLVLENVWADVSREIGTSTVAGVSQSTITSDTIEDTVAQRTTHALPDNSSEFVNGEKARTTTNLDVSSTSFSESIDWTSYYDGTLGPDILPNHVWQVDRKASRLRLFPSNAPPAEDNQDNKETKGRYYTIGGNLLFAGAISNRDDKQAFRGMMALRPDLRQTILNQMQLQSLGVGVLNTTQTTTQRIRGQYLKLVNVTLLDVYFGQARFPLENFWAARMSAPLGGSETFAPTAALGHDVLGRFVITLDQKNHQLGLRLYAY